VLDQLKGYFQAATDLEVYDALGVDKICWVEAPWKRTAFASESDSIHFNQWSVGTIEKPYNGGVYTETVRHPLRTCTCIQELKDFPWPCINDFDFVELQRQCSYYGGRMQMLTFVSLFEIYCSMRSLEQALMDLYMYPELVDFSLDRICGLQVEYIDRALEEAPGIDLVYYSDDMGMQDRAMFSTETWKDRIQPFAKIIVDLVHKHGKQVFYHSDGAAYEIINELVELGIDILNPIQYRCPGMERERLKKSFGDRVVFHGAVENQQILPFGTPEQVRKEVRKCEESLGAEGGYIVAPCHNLQPNTPIENILTLYKK
jgi:uroporphyrinogen decarboxylase